jgi:serine-type D-Ala-D-Ala endopeptidase (penicillin-binding protein 7)
LYFSTYKARKNQCAEGFHEEGGGLMMIKTITARVVLLLASAGFVVGAFAGTAVTHTVERGDTLYSIARENGVSVDDLARINHISKKSALKSGQVLLLYTRSTVAAKSSPPKVVATIRQPATVKTQTRVQAPAVRAKIEKPASGSSKSAYPQLASSSAMVVDATTGQTIFVKNADQTRPIASITKLMTAMVVLDANPSMQEMVVVSDDDVDYLKHTHSRLPVGTKLPRYDMLRLALMSSENRAASSLSRSYPGGKPAFIKAMNNKATQLGMSHTRFYDATGLTPGNVSTAEDLVKMVRAASLYTLIHEFTTTPNREVAIRPNGTPLQYKNTNVLVRELADDWNISISKTGYTQEAGRCLVMMATVANRKAVMVMLDSEGKLSPVGDANRLKDWIESGHAPAQLAAR